MAKPVSDREYQSLAAFRAALRRFQYFSEEEARAAGLTPQQHQAMLAVRGAPQALTVGALAEQLRVRHHSAVGLVDRLAAQGLVARLRGEDDRREVHLALTARGEEILASLAAIHRAELRRLGPQLAALLAGLEEG